MIIAATFKLFFWVVIVAYVPIIRWIYSCLEKQILVSKINGIVIFSRFGCYFG